MPFNFKAYDQQCSRMSKVELRREMAHQDDVIATAGAGTGFALLAIPLTMGLSAVALGGTAPAIINAKKKRSIAKKYLEGSGPEVGPNFSTQPAALQSRPRRPEPSRKKTSEEQLPLYTPVDPASGANLQQTYVPSENVDMDLPPSYDEATLKRMTMMGLLPPALQRGQSISQRATGSSSPNNMPMAAENENSTNTTPEQELANPPESSSPSEDWSQEATQSSSTYSPYSPSTPRTPRTPSPSNDHTRVGPLDQVDHPQKTTGKIPTNPFTSLDEESSSRIPI